MYTGAVALTSGFTNGVGVIWLDNVQCRGTESTLVSCPHLPLGTHNCNHAEDAGVRCGGTSRLFGVNKAITKFLSKGSREHERVLIP